MAGYTAGCDEVLNNADKLFSDMGIEHCKNRMPGEVSGGEAQRGAIARAMIKSPGILFADEPTGALNKKNSNEVLSLMDELNSKGQTIIMVTHDIASAAHGNRILYLEDGRIISCLTLPCYNSDLDKKEREERLSLRLSTQRW